jgi:hypothetical protein
MRWKSPEELRPLKAFLQADTRAIEREVFFCPPNDELRRVMFALCVRHNYKGKWTWGAAAEYLYRALIQGLGLRGLEDSLVELAKPKRGRKEETALAMRIWTLRAERKTVTQIKAIFESEGQYFTEDKIKGYLRKRRRKDIR